MWDKITDIIDKLGEMSPFPYYVDHLIIGLAMGVVAYVVTGSPGAVMVGAGFYAGREVAQWRQLGRFDWPGFVAPLVVCVAVYLVMVI